MSTSGRPSGGGGSPGRGPRCPPSLVLTRTLRGETALLPNPPAWARPAPPRASPRRWPGRSHLRQAASPPSAPRFHLCFSENHRPPASCSASLLPAGRKAGARPRPVPALALVPALDENTRGSGESPQGLSSSRGSGRTPRRFPWLGARPALCGSPPRGEGTRGGVQCEGAPQTTQGPRSIMFYRKSTRSPRKSAIPEVSDAQTAAGSASRVRIEQGKGLVQAAGSGTYLKFGYSSSRVLTNFLKKCKQLRMPCPPTTEVWGNP